VVLGWCCPFGLSVVLADDEAALMGSEVVRWLMGSEAVRLC